MTRPTILDPQYDGTVNDFLKVKADKSGAARLYTGSVSVPSGTAADLYVGLIPFNKGFRCTINDKSVYAGNFGAGSTTLNLGYIYDSASLTDDVDAWASLSTAAQSGGWITVDEIEGMTFVAEGDGWIAVQLKAAAADATAPVSFQIVGSYDGLGVDNQNNQN